MKKQPALIKSGKQTDELANTDIRNEPQTVPMGNNTLRLHATIGNQAISRLLQSKKIQTKLEVGSSDDKYETEADEIASQVVNQIATPGAIPPPIKNITSMIQNQTMSSQSPDVNSQLSGKILGLQGGRPLSGVERGFFEPRFGADFSWVRLHTDNNAAELSKELKAKAFTHGRDLVFGRDEYQFNTSSGKHLIAHELTHVMQQNANSQLGFAQNGIAQKNIVQKMAESPSAVQSQANTTNFSNSLIVADNQLNLQTGQVRKTEFLTQARDSVCEAIEPILAAVGRTTADCPYLNLVFSFFEGRDADYIESTLRRFAPDLRNASSADDYIPVVVERVSQSARDWVSSGEISGLPNGIPRAFLRRAVSEEGTSSLADSIQPKAKSGGARLDQNPTAILSQLGTGKSLDVDIASRMGSAFRTDFSQVRMHNDDTSANLSNNLNARAFTLGKHVAFGAGEYKPGTLIGDALIAHELAHVVQQQDSAANQLPQTKGSYQSGKALEDDADRSAVSAVVSMWSRGSLSLANFAQNAMPRLKSGLKLSRCPDDPLILEPSTIQQILVVDELELLYARKNAILTGDEPRENLPQINRMIAETITALRALGVQLDEDAIYERVTSHRWDELFEVQAELVESAEGPHYYGERLTYQLTLDYVPPGRSVEVGWRFKTSENGSEYQFLRQGNRSSSRSLTLDEAFWNLTDFGTTRQQGQMEVIAHVYLGEDTTAVTTARTGMIPFQEITPASLTISASQTVNVVGGQTTFTIGEWIPPQATYSIDWYDGTTLIAEDRPILRHAFTTAGTHRLIAKIYQVERFFGISEKHLMGDPLSLQVEIQNAEQAGRDLLARTNVADLPDLSSQEVDIFASITEIQQRVQRGGEQSAYWEARLEAQESRLANIRRLAPNATQSTELPEDATQIQAGTIYSGPIPAVLVLPQAGGAQPLQIYLTIQQDGDNWKARLLDITSSDVKKFDGEASTPLDAYRAAFQDWATDHPYPRGGEVIYRFSPPGWNVASHFATTNNWNTAWAWIDGILTIGGVVVAGLLLMAPDPTTGTKWLGYTVLAATVARSSIAIYQNIDRGIAPLDSRNVIEGVSILTAFLGLGGSTLRQAGITSLRPTVFRAGNWMVLTSVAGDAGTVTYVSAHALGQLRAVQSDPTMDEGQRVMQTLRLISTLLMQGVMFMVSNREMFQHGLRWSDYIPTNTRATAAAARAAGPDARLELGSRLDIALELKNAGDITERLRTRAQAPDGPHPYSDNELVDRFTALQWMNAELNQVQTTRMLSGLSTESLHSFQQMRPTRAHDMVNNIADDALVNRLAPTLGGANLESLANAATTAQMRQFTKAFGVNDLNTFVSDLGERGIRQLLDGQTPAQIHALSGTLSNPVIRNLAQDLTGTQIAHLNVTHGPDLVRWAATDLHGNDATRLLTDVNADAIVGLRDVSGQQAFGLLNAFGAPIINGAAVDVRGSGLQQLLDSLGTATARGVSETRVNAGDTTRLATQAERLANAQIEAGVGAGTGELVNPPALGGQSLVVDANFIRYLNYALEKEATGAALLPVEQNTIDFFRRLQAAGVDIDLRASNVAISETPAVPHVPARQGIPVAVSRDSPDYNGLLTRLEGHTVGGVGATAAADRSVVADAFFAGPAGYRTSFATADRRVLNGLARMAGINPNNQRIAQAFPNGFEVVDAVTGRRIFVFPIRSRAVPP